MNIDIAAEGRTDGRTVLAAFPGSGFSRMSSIDSTTRVKDVDFERGRIIVRQGQGRKDRVARLPERVKPRLVMHLEAVHRQHDKDVAAGCGGVPLPEALDRKYPSAGESWPWQFVFPAARVCRDRL